MLKGLPLKLHFYKTVKLSKINISAHFDGISLHTVCGSHTGLL